MKIALSIESLPVRAALIAAVSLATVGSLSLTPALDSLERNVARRLEYDMRLRLGRTPSLDARLKIYVWDDATTALVAKWGVSPATDAPLSTWSQVLGAIAATRPAAIFVDKLFENPLGLREAESFVKQTAALPVPVIVGAYVVGEALPFREPLVDGALLARDGATDRNLRLPSNAVDQHAYGPNPKVAAGFHGIGHILLSDGPSVPLAVPVGGGRLVPSFLVPLFGGWRSAASGLELGGRRVHLAAGGQLPVNLLPRAMLMERARSLGFLLNELVAGRPATGLAPGDYVVILPSFYSGNTDFKDTPAGRMEGGLVQAALVNSFLSGDLLRPIGGRGLLSALAILVATTMAVKLSPLVFWPAFFVVLTGVALAGILSFAFASLVAPWLVPALAFAVAGGLTSVERQRVAHLQRLLLDKDLSLGRSAQATFLPDTREGRVGEFSYKFVFEPYGPLSGDWMQVFAPLQPVSGLVGVFAIGDVVGKGTSAALNTAVISSIWARHAKEWAAGATDFDALLKDLHGTIHTTFRGYQNTTLLLAAIFTDKVRTISCGGFSWSTVDANGKVARIRVPAQDVLGATNAARNFRWGEVSLQPGSTLLAFTDGVLDGAKPFFNFQRSIDGRTMPDAAASFETIERQAREAGADSSLPDDKTMLMIRREAD